MYGPPEPVQGQCNAELHIGDDFGDNRCTMRCKLPAGHDGMHREEYQRMLLRKSPEEKPQSAQVIVTWEGNDYEPEPPEEDDLFSSMESMPENSVQTQDENGKWVPATPLPLMCEVDGCDEPVTLDDQYERLDKNLPNGWGNEPEVLCSKHAVGRTKIKKP